MASQGDREPISTMSLPGEFAEEPPPIAGYETLRLIGQGGMGDVYVARQEALGRLVAIKYLKPGGTRPTDERVVRFRREAELMARVSHPNIVGVFDSGTVGDRHFLVMEYVEGGDLRRLMHSDRPMPPGEARPILAAVADALARLHREGILHRDLKAENILMQDGVRPKVADFGIAVLRDGAGALTATRFGMGTPGYTSPEQLYGLKVDERADQFSLAALAYELLTGHVPLGVIRPPSRLVPGLPASIDDVLLRALRDDRDDRYPTLDQFASSLDAALASPPPRRIGPIKIVAAAAFALIALAAAIQTFPRGHRDRHAGKQSDVAPPPAPAPVPGPAQGQAAATPAAETKHEDPLGAFIEKQLERLSYAYWEQGGRRDDSARDDWLKALQVTLGHGPLAPRIEKELSDRAFHKWEEGGRREGTSLRNWLEVRQEFLDEHRIGVIINDLLKERAYKVWVDRGNPEGKDLENWMEARRQLIGGGEVVPREIRDDFCLRFVFVPAGKVAFQEVLPDGMPGPPAPRVLEVASPFYLSDREITRAQFRRFVDATDYRTEAEIRGKAVGFDAAVQKEIESREFHWRNPGYAGDAADDHPVVQVSGHDASAFCQWLGAREHASYRLPDEVEWELACRAGMPTDGERGDRPEGWHAQNSGLHPHPVGSLDADRLGLFDMLGNVVEWCQPRASAPPADDCWPIRGAGWILTPAELRPSWRMCPGPAFCHPSLGFRVARGVPGTEPEGP